MKFAAMNSYDLLEASEKAVSVYFAVVVCVCRGCKEVWNDIAVLLILQIGRSNMYEDHQKLKTSSRAIAALEVNRTGQCATYCRMHVIVLHCYRIRCSRGRRTM